MIEYDIISAENNEDLIKKVNGKLAKGWKLVGAPFVATGTIYQTITYRSLLKAIKDFFNGLC